MKILRQTYPAATWEVKRFDGMPYLKTDLGYFVEVAVTVEGVTLSQVHPVLDHRNKTIEKPSAFDINSSLQRCLVKAIALHGLGIWIYAGEDLPDGAEPPKLSESQVGAIRTLMAEVEANEDRFLAFFKVKNIFEIPASDYDRAVTMLGKKRKPPPYDTGAQQPYDSEIDASFEAQRT